MKFSFLVSLAFILTASANAAHICGTQAMLEHLHSIKAEGAAARTSYNSTTSCDAEAYYNSDSIQKRTTAHFRIYYVLSGPHKTTEAFVDSTAYYLEKAWTFHTKKLGMKEPLGGDTTWHYKQVGDSSLYPVEILDIDMIRDNASLLGGYCSGCYGITFQISDANPEATELVIDNDFRYSTPQSSQGSIDYEGNSCTYPISEYELYNESNGLNYATYFGEGIHVTSFHELYHATQARYIDFTKYYSYWIEASAVGAEELGAPAINDYWAYLSSFFQSTGIAFDSQESPYGIGTWALYNAKAQGIKFDASLWERYSVKPDSSFETVFATALENKNQDPDSEFSDFATRLFFSSSRASRIDTALYVTGDARDWPTKPRLRNPTSKALTLSPPAINYFRLTTDSIPDLSSFVGKATVAFFGKGEKTEFVSLDTATLQSLYAKIASADTSVLILSRLREQNSTRIAKDSLPMRAYPNPWRGSTELCFAGLPSDKDFIEIRTRIGKLVKRFKYSGTMLCLDEDLVKDLLAPGLYHFRAGGRNKLKPFIIIY